MNKFLKITFSAALIICVICFSSGCVYSFSGGSLPDHLKTVQVILFEDNTNRYDLKLADRITKGITAEIEKQKLMDIENSAESHAKIFGTITKFEEVVASQTRDEIADERKITLSLKLTFYDRTKTQEILSTDVTRIESFVASGGETLRDETIEKIIKNICEDAVIKLTSNW